MKMAPAFSWVANLARFQVTDKESHFTAKSFLLLLNSRFLARKIQLHVSLWTKCIIELVYPSFKLTISVFVLLHKCWRCNASSHWVFLKVFLLVVATVFYQSLQCKLEPDTQEKIWIISYQVITYFSFSQRFFLYPDCWCVNLVKDELLVGSLQIDRVSYSTSKLWLCWCFSDDKFM